MLSKRQPSEDVTLEFQPPLLEAETLRHASEVQLHQPMVDAKSPDEKVSIFWRIFGGTILSIVALLCITAYQGIAGSIRDLQNELNQLKEAKGDLVKKDEYGNSKTQMWNRIQDMQATNSQQMQTITASLTTLKGDQTRQDEVLKGEVARLNKSVESLQADKRDILAAQALALTAVKDRQSLTDQQLRALEQSVRTVEVQLKVTEQLGKDIQVVSTLVSGLTAKAMALEAQLKSTGLERAELSKSLSDLRERVAKLEVQREPKPAVKPTTTTPPKNPKDPDE